MDKKVVIAIAAAGVLSVGLIGYEAVILVNRNKTETVTEDPFAATEEEEEEIITEAPIDESEWEIVASVPHIIDGYMLYKEGVEDGVYVASFISDNEDFITIEAGKDMNLTVDADESKDVELKRITLTEYYTDEEFVAATWLDNSDNTFKITAEGADPELVETIAEMTYLVEDGKEVQ